ncbi:glycosyltransferase family 39 protein [bacterium]|nr:glycosyltransferase family 39 protein [candidate division CSSED10-310 bacterium]
MKRFGGNFHWISGVIVFAAALALRIIRLGSMNAVIDDLSARMAILAMDGSRGILHFPFAPYIFEFDETGMAYLILPFVVLFKFKWVSFQFLGAIIGALTTLFVFCIVSRYHSRPGGVLAAWIHATLPAALLWNRYFFMSRGDVLIILTLSALLCIRSPVRLRSVLLSGVLIGLASYVHLLGLLGVPAILTVVFLDTRRDRAAWRTVPGYWAVFGLSVMAVLSPLLINLIRMPYYLLWRETHFGILHRNPSEVLMFYFSNLGSLASELFWETKNFIYQPQGSSLLPIPVVLAAAWGTAVCMRRPGASLSAGIWAYISAWFLVIGTVKPEPWRGIYFTLPLPFFCILAGVGVWEAYLNLVKRIAWKKTSAAAAITLVVLMGGLHIHSFFFGSHRIIPRTGVLVRLQEDLRTERDIPFFFCRRLPETMHFHFPFWFVTRTSLTRVAIFDWNDDSAYLMPDKAPLELVPDPFRQACFVMSGEDALKFVTRFSSLDCRPPRKLKQSGLMVITCGCRAGEIAERTYLKTSVPPIFDIAAD